MKLSRSNREQASVLLVTMIFVMTLGVILYSYLALVQNSQLGVARAQTWNAALPIAEAGIEEGLACLNSGGSFSTLSHSLNGGNYQVKYFGGSSPCLISTGVVTAPVGGQSVSRTVKVVISKQGLFTKGLVALNDIRMNGNSIASDSWNSEDPTESDNGLYNGYSGTNGDIASVYGFVNIGNQTIRGSLYLGPTASYDGSGTITGTIYTDANLQYPDAALPTADTNGNAVVWTPAPTTTTGTGKGKSANSFHDFTTGGYYTISDSYPVVVEPGVNVTLDIQPSNWNPTSLTINGGTSNSGNVVLYVESGSLTMAGNSSGGAAASRPKNLFIFGLPGVTSITFSGTSTFVGVIYAPEASMTLNGGGNNNNLIGAAVVNSATMNGHYKFHYDTSLSQYYYSGFIVSSWEEL